MLESYAAMIGPDPDAIISEMDDRASQTGFPTVGRAVGGWLTQLARMVDAHQIFEFGSGFGYSAYWFAQALPSDGRIVLTEIDKDELDDARSYFEQAELTHLAKFEHGDAIEIISSYSGPFDIVLIDNEKERYVDAFRAVREKVRPGGLVVADNITGGPFSLEEVYGTVVNEDPVGNEAADGIATFLTTVGSDPAFETVLLPLGEGLSISHRVE